MTDLYGSAPLPVAAPAAPTDALSDPALNAVLRWALAILNFECGAAWAAVAPGETLVRKTRAHRPERNDFGSVNELPALFCYSDNSRFQRYADALFGRDRTISLLWVFSPSDQFAAAERSGILAGLGAALHKAVEMSLGRHPGWVDTGDTDPHAARFGSSILNRTGFERLTFVESRYASIDLELPKGKASFDAVHFEFSAREYFHQGPLAESGSSIHLTINQNPSAPAFVQVTDCEPPS